MNLSQQLPSLDRLAHAYLLEGGVRQAEMLLEHLEHHLGVPRSANPDLFVRDYELFGIEESRQLRERALQKPFRQERFCFVITAHDITTEAQNALLKTFEDPSGNPVFFLIVSRAELLLPTLRSRCAELTVAVPDAAPDSDGAQRFLTAKPATRIEQLTPLVKAKSVVEVVTFLSALELVLAARVHEREVQQALTSVYRVRRYVHDRGASLKTLLEALALTMPTLRS